MSKKLEVATVTVLGVTGVALIGALVYRGVRAFLDDWELARDASDLLGEVEHEAFADGYREAMEDAEAEADTYGDGYEAGYDDGYAAGVMESQDAEYEAGYDIGFEDAMSSTGYCGSTPVMAAKYGICDQDALDCTGNPDEVFEAE